MTCELHRNGLQGGTGGEGRGGVRWHDRGHGRGERVEYDTAQRQGWGGFIKEKDKVRLVKAMLTWTQIYE